LLFFVGLGLFVTIVRLGFLMAIQVIPVTAPDVWRKMTLPGGEPYHPLMKPLLILELVGNSVTILFAAVRPRIIRWCSRSGCARWAGW